MGHFTKMCFTKPAHLQPQQYHRGKPKQAHQIVVPELHNKPHQNTCDSDNDDDFIIAFQLHAQPQRSIHNQRVNTSYAQKCLYANIPYQLKPYLKHNKYLHIQLDTCANVNLMPESMYQPVFNDPHTAKLAKNDIDLTVYTRHSIDLIGKCTFYMLNKATKQPIKVDFYIAKEEGSVLLSWETIFQLQLLDVKPRLEYLPPRATLISSAANYLKREVHAQSTTSIPPTSTSTVPQENTPSRVKIVKSKGQIQEQYPELFKVIGRFPGEPYHIHFNPSITPKQTPCRPIPVHLKQTFWQELKKCLLPESSNLSMKQLCG